MYTGPKIKTEGLVFGYDTGYKISSLDISTRFYGGEPTTNLDAASTDGMGRDDKRPFEYVPHSTAQDETGLSTTPDPPVPGMNVWKIQNSIPDNYSRYGLKYDMSTELNGYDKDYTTSVYVWIPSGVTLGNATNSWVYQNTSGVDWHSFRGDEGTYYGAGSIMSSTKTADTSKRDQWQRLYNVWNPLTANIDYPVVAADNKWVVVSFRPNLIGSGSESYLYVTSLQTEEGSHRTPFTYEPRADGNSISGSLIDLTETTVIDTSKLVFNSEGQPTWNNSTSWIYLGNTPTFQITGNVTVECVCNPVSADGNMFSMNGNSGYRIRILTGGDFWIYSNGNSVQAGGPSYGKYNHCVGVFSSTGLRAYVNGKLIASNTTAFSPAAYGSNGAYVGAFNVSSELFNGEIPVMKVYNTALTEQEIQENFRAYRTRFNI